MILSNNTFADSVYRTLKTITGVNVNKEFTIVFNEELNPVTISSEYFKIVTDDKSEENVSVIVEADSKDKKIVRIKSYHRFTQGKKYKIVVSPGVRNKDDIRLGTGIIQPFTVKNFYAGLPVEGGIIIIGNEAYALEYLVKNSSKKNEILKGQYKVFYIDETMKNKIKDVIGGEFVDGTTLPPGYNFREPLYYTDAKGERSVYKWNIVYEEFRKEVPKINFFVTVNEKNPSEKVLMYKIKQIIGVENVKYFRMDSSTNYYKIDEPYIFSSSELNDKITLYSASMTKLAQADVYNLIEGSVWRNLEILEAKPDGNSAGNIINNGYVAADEDGYIVYNNTGDGGKLYVNDTNGVYHAVISDDFAQYINISDGWIYYSNYGDKGKLYKMRTDGSEKMKLSDDRVVFLNVMGDYIYYTNYSDKGQIYRIRKDGRSDVEYIMKDGKVVKNDEIGKGEKVLKNIDDEAYFLNIVGEWIYYSNVSDHYRVYAVNMAGNYRIRLSDEGASSIQVVDDWIYFTNNRGELKKVKKDGSKETKELGGVVAKFKRGYFFNVVNDWIYYSNAADSNRLYKIKIDGSENIRMTREAVTYISVVYNTVYFVSNGELYTVPASSIGKTRPKKVEKVTSGKKVIQVDDIKVTIPYEKVNDKIEILENEFLPTKVPGILSDNRMRQLVVQWDRERVSVYNGVRRYRGKLIGYNQYINLEMTIPSQMISHETTIKIYNNPGTRSGYIEMESDIILSTDSKDTTKLRVGDVITIYEDERLTTPLRSATVTRIGDKNKAIFRNMDLDRFGVDKYYISIRRNGKAPSKGTEFALDGVPEIITNIKKTTKDKDFEGLGLDGRDFYIPGFKIEKTNQNGANRKDVYAKIFVATGSKVIAGQDKGLRPFDNSNLYDSSDANGKFDWQGSRFQSIDVNLDKGTERSAAERESLIQENVNYVIAQVNGNMENFSRKDARRVADKIEESDYTADILEKSNKQLQNIHKNRIEQVESIIELITDELFEEIEMNRDSYGKVLKGERFNIFIVSKYKFQASPDAQGSRPSVIEWVVSDPAPITVASEGIPKQPKLKTQTVRYGEYVELSVAPKVGETAYLIPVWDEKFSEEEYLQFIKGTWFENVAKIENGEIISSWIDDAVNWESQDGSWDFRRNGKYKKFIDDENIVMMEGDGKTRRMRIPTGIRYEPKEMAGKYWNEVLKTNHDDIKKKICAIYELTKEGIEIDKNKIDERIKIIDLNKYQTNGILSGTYEKDDLFKTIIAKEYDNSQYYAPNVKYKLVIKNEVGASGEAEGTLTVDNQPPIVSRELINTENRTSDGKIYIKLGGQLIYRDTYDYRSYVYIYKDNLDQYSNVELLEAAVASGEVIKEPMSKGDAARIPIPRLKPTYAIANTPDEIDGLRDNRSYIVVVADEVGNLKELQPIVVYVNTLELEKVVLDLENAYREEVFYQKDMALMKSKIDDINDMITLIKSNKRADVYPTQTEIDKLVKDTIEKMEELGVPRASKANDDLYVKNNLIKFTRYLRDYYERFKVLDIENLEDRDLIWLPRTFGASAGYKVNIQWESSDENLLRTRDSGGNEMDRGEVDATNVEKTVELRVKCMKDGKEIFGRSFTLKIKARIGSTTP